MRRCAALGAPDSISLGPPANGNHPDSNGERLRLQMHMKYGSNILALKTKPLATPNSNLWGTAATRRLRTALNQKVARFLSSLRGSMGTKLRHLLMFLLIILKEPNMPEAGCSCASSGCDCSNQGLTSIPQGLPTSISQLHVTRNQIIMLQAGAFTNLTSLRTLYLPLNQITIIQAAGIALIGTVILTIWCKRRTKNPPSKPKTNIVLSNLTMPAVVVTSGHDQTGPRQPTEETSLAPPKEKLRLKYKHNSVTPPRGDDDDDCVYVEPDGALYMTPEDVLYEIPANSHHKQPVVGTHDCLHYYQPQATLPTDDGGYIIISPDHMKGH
uniref:LRRNT domain-containing protein n=1 Tax=Branchiostoma floridae TaxID=7739 RepID=C3Y1K6_BRAFL|eukprot:XP_002609736.1 hypothetical protein BRAFLDRAFT_78547 [Branchiostoma floridae]